MGPHTDRNSISTLTTASLKNKIDVVNAKKRGSTLEKDDNLETEQVKGNLDVR